MQRSLVGVLKSSGRDAAKRAGRAFCRADTPRSGGCLRRAEHQNQGSRVAVRKAIDDAGINLSEVDGLVTYTMDSSDEVEVARTVEIGDMTFRSKVNYGGCAAVGLIAHAAMAVATGQARNVVVFRALNGRSGQRMGQDVSDNIISSDLIHWSWYIPFELLPPAT